MALYAIGDLHLSLGVSKPMDVFGGEWTDYMSKLEEGFKILTDDDMCVLCGDTSWGMSLEESLPDFKYIEKLPGKKIILKGNHDYWWSTLSKMNNFFADNDIRSISVLHNNCYFYENIAICGTRGWLNDDAKNANENAQIMTREAGRLRASLQKAVDTQSGKELICFLHYPPRSGNIVCHEIISVLEEYNVSACYYGHLHSGGHKLAHRGITGGIKYDIISSDYLNFKPYKIA